MTFPPRSIKTKQKRLIFKHTQTIYIEIHTNVHTKINVKCYFPFGCCSNKLKANKMRTISKEWNRPKKDILND